jgi:hypothetical protein
MKIFFWKTLNRVNKRDNKHQELGATEDVQKKYFQFFMPNGVK